MPILSSNKIEKMPDSSMRLENRKEFHFDNDIIIPHKLRKWLVQNNIDIEWDPFEERIFFDEKIIRREDATN